MAAQFSRPRKRGWVAGQWRNAASRKPLHQGRPYTSVGNCSRLCNLHEKSFSAARICQKFAASTEPHLDSWQKEQVHAGAAAFQSAFQKVQTNEAKLRLFVQEHCTRAEGSKGVVTVGRKLRLYPIAAQLRLCLGPPLPERARRASW